MKIKVFTILILLSTFPVYLEWGTDNHAFLIVTEWDILKKLFSHPQETLHPLIILPLVGQILLLYIIIAGTTKKWLYYASTGLLSLLIGMVTIAGILSLNAKMLFSVTPFWTFSMLLIFQLNRRKS